MHMHILNTQKNNKAFTLIELLVVIAIIGLLATVVMVSLNSARKKARDTRRLEDFKQVSTALQMYYDDFGQYPNSPNNCCSIQDHNNNFKAIVQELINAGYMNTIPEDPKNSGKYVYIAYKYAGGTKPGLLLITHLETIDATTTGPFGSCRPFDNNWCSYTQAGTHYCLCHPY